MTESESIRGVLILGAIGGAILSLIAFLLSRFARDARGRTVLAIGLFAAAGAYFGFAIVGPGSRLWILIELMQVSVFSLIGLYGWRGSPNWLALGWALHPLWDVGVHYVGPGHSFAPMGYVFACLSFDLVMAAYVFLAYKVLLRSTREI
ncbi:MAG TPA: DUF6010 family protein [Pyrinomonadaceae bacterium]